MYNRYIPQDDGSFRKNRVTEQPNSKPQPPSISQQVCEQDPPQPPHSASDENHKSPKTPPPCKQNISAASFLRQLFPKNIDTGDLLIILLLLLMAGDCSDDKNTAMLTLALYLFL